MNERPTKRGRERGGERERVLQRLRNERQMGRTKREKERENEKGILKLGENEKREKEKLIIWRVDIL